MRTSTLDKATLSEAVPEMVMAPETVVPSEGNVMATEGGVVSGSAGVVNVKSAETARFPEKSLDFTLQW